MGKKNKIQTYGGSKASCHKGHNLIFTTDTGIEVWAGGKNRSGGWHTMEVYPQLAIGPSETLSAGFGSNRGTDVPEGWSCESFTTTQEPPLMASIDWPDFDIPNVPVTFWVALCNDILDNNITTVSTQCAGGHGRTGVQLSILAYLLCPSKRKLWADAHDLIEWVREEHCTHAVETNSQQKYVADACGLPVGKSTISHTTPVTTMATAYTGSLAKVTYSPKDWELTNFCHTCDIMHYEDELLVQGECPQCQGELDKPLDKDCTACEGKASINDKEMCDDCGYDMFNDELLDTVYTCDNCLVNRKSNMFVGNSADCIICETESMGMKGTFKAKKGQPTIRCDDCKKYKPTRYIKTLAHGKAHCYSCKKD